MADRVAAQDAAGADGPRAGLVIALPDGQVRAMCVALGVEEISGEELLRRAGVEVSARVTPLGAMVCGLDGQGCDHPRDPCWCECRSLGGGCRYWAYHVREADGWRYAPLGPSARRVRHGDVDGWAWGAGSLVAGAAPPEYSWTALCGDEPARRATGAAATQPALVQPATVATQTAAALVGTGRPSTGATATAPVAGGRAPGSSATVKSEGGLSASGKRGTATANHRATGSGPGSRGTPGAGGADSSGAAEAAASEPAPVRGMGQAASDTGQVDRDTTVGVDGAMAGRSGAGEGAADVSGRVDGGGGAGDGERDGAGDGVAGGVKRTRTVEGARSTSAGSAALGGDSDGPGVEQRGGDGAGAALRRSGEGSRRGDYLFFGWVVLLLAAGVWWLRRAP